MTDPDDQKSKSVDDRSTVDTTATKKPIGDGFIVTTVTATSAVIFFGLKLVGMRQCNALLTSTLLPWFMSLPAWEV